MRRLVRARQAVSIVLLAPVAALVVLSPALVHADPLHQDLMASLVSPGADWLLGTDELGRSVLARVAFAAHLSVGLAFTSVLAAWVVGMALGMVAAWCGGRIEQIAMRGADTMMAFPGLLLTLLVAGLLGGGLGAVVLGTALAQWPQAARTTRALAAGAVRHPHVEAARFAGLGAGIILTKDVLPPLLPQLLTQAALSMAHAVQTIAALGFLGIGLAPPAPEWGTMIAESASFLTEAPWIVAAPACLLVTTVLGLTLLAEEAASA